MSDVSSVGPRQIDKDVYGLYLMTDAQFLAGEYRIILKLLQDLKIGYTTIIDLEAAIDTYIRFKLPKEYHQAIRDRSRLADQYRQAYWGEIQNIHNKYHRIEDRQRKLIQIETECKFKALLDILDDIKNVLEKAHIINEFEPIEIEPIAPPQLSGETSGARMVGTKEVVNNE